MEPVISRLAFLGVCISRDLSKVCNLSKLPQVIQTATNIAGPEGLAKSDLLSSLAGKFKRSDIEVTIVGPIFLPGRVDVLKTGTQQAVARFCRFDALSNARRTDSEVKVESFCINEAWFAGEIAFGVCIGKRGQRSAAGENVVPDDHPKVISDIIDVEEHAGVPVVDQRVVDHVQS